MLVQRSHSLAMAKSIHAILTLLQELACTGWKVVRRYEAQRRDEGVAVLARLGNRDGFVVEVLLEIRVHLGDVISQIGSNVQCHSSNLRLKGWGCSFRAAGQHETQADRAA